MRKPEELCSIVTSWNETHPNRKDQPTLYFVIDRLLQNIVDALDFEVFEVFEDNEQILKFRCTNFPLIGELELKKKTNNLFLLLDLNPYSLVIDGEKRSKEYTITAFKDDYKNRVAEFVFLHLDEIRLQLDLLHKSFLRTTLEAFYTKEVSTEFVLDFNELYNKYENFLNAVHSIFFNTLGTEFFYNSVYGLHKHYKCIQMLECQHCSSQDDSALEKVTVSLKVYPVTWKLKYKKCFDNIFYFVKDNRKDLFKEYSLRDLVNGKADVYGKMYHYNSFVDTFILNKNTFKFIFPDEQFPEWCLIWAGCSVYITEDISDGHILFIKSQDDINGMKNAICIDKENNCYFVNSTSDSVRAFDVTLNGKSELISVTDKISTGSIHFNHESDSWLTSEKIIVETTIMFSDGKSESLLKTIEHFYQLVPYVTYLHCHAKELEELLENKLKQLKNTPCVIMTTISNPEHNKDTGKYIGVSKTFFEQYNDLITPIKDDTYSSFLSHINSLKNKHRDFLLKNPNQILYDISPDTIFCAYNSIYNDIKKDIQIKRKELNLEIDDHIRLTMYFGKKDKLNHRNTLLMSILINVYFLMEDRVVDEIIISDSQQKYRMDTKLLQSVTESMKKFGAENNFEFSYDIEVL